MGWAVTSSVDCEPMMGAFSAVWACSKVLARHRPSDAMARRNNIRAILARALQALKQLGAGLAIERQANAFLVGDDRLIGSGAEAAIGAAGFKTKARQAPLQVHALGKA